MKRMLILVAALIIAPAAMAQVITVPFKVDKTALVRDIERTNKTLENEKRAQRGQPWLDNANAYYAAAAAVASQIYGGMPLEELNAKLGKDAPQPVDKTISMGAASKTFKVISLPEVDIYIAPDPSTGTDIVQFWFEKGEVYEGAAEKAIESFKKAAELDKKLLPKVKEGLQHVADIYKIRANAYYNIGDNMPAAENFLKAYDLLKDPLVGILDGDLVFNGGYLYIANEDYDKGIEVFEDAVEHEIWAGGNIPYFLSWAYLKKGEEYYPKAKEILLKGKELFPENENIPEGLINYYSLSGDDFTEIIDVLEDALKKDPSKKIIWDGLGQAYLKIDDRAKTIEFFKKFVAEYPDDFGANYYLGDQLMEEGEALYKEANENESLSKAQRDELMAKAMGLYREAFPVSEKAYIYRPEEVAALQRVTHILFRLKDEPDMAPVFDKYNKIYEATRD